MDTLLQQLFNGFSLFGVYALIAIGITLTFGLTGLVNFAHGEMLMLGGFSAYTLTEAGVPFFVTIAIVTIGILLLGASLERGVFHHTLSRPVDGFLASLALIIIFQHVAVLEWGFQPRTIVPPFQNVWEVIDVRISASRVIIIIVALAAIAAFYWFLRFTKPGKAIRAAAEDRQAAELMGINVSGMDTMVFALGAGLAGLAGGMVVTVIAVTPFVGAAFVIKGFAIAIMGGLGRIEGAVAGALLFAMVETLVAGYVSFQWAGAVAFFVMMVVVVLRPQGIFRGSHGAHITG